MPGPYKSITNLNIVSNLLEQVVGEMRTSIIESESWESDSAGLYRERLTEISQKINTLAHATRAHSQNLERLFNGIPA